MSAFFEILMLTTMMAAAEPDITRSQLQNNCEQLAAETFRQELANDEDRYNTEHITTPI